MENKKGVIGGVVALVVLALLVNFLPFERQSSPLTDWLRGQAEEQEENSDKITSEIVKGAEGDGRFAGEHEVDGSNWAIPNLLRHWVLGD